MEGFLLDVSMIQLHVIALLVGLIALCLALLAALPA